MLSAHPSLFRKNKVLYLYKGNGQLHFATAEVAQLVEQRFRKP
jgi:hypothetical protein